VKLAGHTLGTPDLSLRQALDLFHSLDLEGAEIIWQDGYRCGLAERATPRRLADVAAMAEALGLEVVCLVPYTVDINSAVSSSRALALESFRHCIDAAAALDCRRIRVYAGRFLPAEEPLRSAKMEPLMASLASMRDWAVDAGVTLCVENHFNTMAVGAGETAMLLAAVAERCGDDAGLGALYDPANLAFTHREPPDEALRAQNRWVRHVHVKDLVFVEAGHAFAAADVAMVEADARSVRSRVVGEGVLDWAEIVGGLAAQGYDGYLSLEYEYRWHPDDLPPPEVGLKRGANHLRGVLDRAAGVEQL